MNELRDNGAELGLTADRLRLLELGKNKALLAGIMRLAIQRTLPDRERTLDAPYRLLSAAEGVDPQAVTSVLASPQFGAWANDALHCLLEDAAEMNGIPRETGLGRLAMFAATAAIRAGLPCDVAVPLRDGSASFPGLGVAYLDTTPPWEWGRARLDASGCHVRSRTATVDVPVSWGKASANWSPLLQVTAIEQGLCLEVVLDHIDPFLDRYGTAQRRTTDPDLARWRHLIETGWQILARNHQALAALAASAIRTVVPLIAPGHDRMIGGTEETSFGAIAMSLPPDALGMAETLVHESHHAVLGALRDIEPLVCDEGPDQARSFLGYAPWRDDPRPAHALLQGVYAHYGMGQFWRREYLAGPAGDQERAAVAFARMSAMTERGARSLAESGLLTRGRPDDSWGHRGRGQAMARRATAGHRRAAHRRTHAAARGPLAGPLAREHMIRHPDWPHRQLDVRRLREAGVEAVPFRSVVLKVHSRCNLACDYCYVYEMADQGWRRQPLTMSPPVVAAAVRRVAEHAGTHDLDSIQVSLHGGEPLLAGAAFIDDLAQRLRRAMPARTRLDLVVQTNATRLDRPLLDVLARNGIRIGVSLDGDQAATDRHRQYPSGLGSYESVVRACELLRSADYRQIYGGLLCTVSLENDPVETYEALAVLEPPLIDFRLPYGTWTAPPPGRQPDGSTPYADWLLAAFRRWTQAPPQTRPAVRTFDAIIRLVVGEYPHAAPVGLAPSAVIVIDTDGAIKQDDALYAAYDGAADTGLSVLTDDLDAALDHPATAAAQIGLLALSDQCLACRVRDVCGGGYYPHRYRAGDGFRNPSVYCPDLLALITAIRDHVDAEVSRLFPGGHGRPGNLVEDGLDLHVYPALLPGAPGERVLGRQLFVESGQRPRRELAGGVPVSGRPQIQGQVGGGRESACRVPRATVLLATTSSPIFLALCASPTAARSLARWVITMRMAG